MSGCLYSEKNPGKAMNLRGGGGGMEPGCRRVGRVKLQRLYLAHVTYLLQPISCSASAPRDPHWPLFLTPLTPNVKQNLTVYIFTKRKGCLRRDRDQSAAAQRPDLMKLS